MSNLPLIESWAQLEPVLLPFLVRCGAAVVCGGLIGLERELKGKPAGLRTNILICVGAAIYMCAGLLVSQGSPGVDPSRIGAQVVTGIGFLGAGSILQSGGRVTGLTSAATIWVVAAIGILAGTGYPLLAMMAAGMVVLTLVALRVFERRWVDALREHPDDRVND